MPHVIVHFDPTKVEQELIDKLKLELQQIVARALIHLSGEEQDPKEICVRQQSAHPTDVNMATIEIEIQAGNAKGRDADMVAQSIVTYVMRLRLLRNHLGLGDCCVWLRFSSNNGFALFPDRHQE